MAIHSMVILSPISREQSLRFLIPARGVGDLDDEEVGFGTTKQRTIEGVYAQSI